MKKVDQTDFTEIGNCFSACIASIIELPLALIPHFRADHGKEMVIEARKWLLENFNLSLVGAPARTVLCPATLCIGAVPSNAHPGNYHAVVGTWDGVTFTLLHDPNPNNPPCHFEPERLYFIVSNDLRITEVDRLRPCVQCMKIFKPLKAHQKVCCRECGLELLECLKTKPKRTSEPAPLSPQS